MVKSINVSDDLHKAIRLFCIQNNDNITSAVHYGMTQFLSEHNITVGGRADKRERDAAGHLMEDKFIEEDSFLATDSINNPDNSEA